MWSKKQMLFHTLGYAWQKYSFDVARFWSPLNQQTWSTLKSFNLSRILQWDFSKTDKTFFCEASRTPSKHHKKIWLCGKKTCYCKASLSSYKIKSKIFVFDMNRPDLRSFKQQHCFGDSIQSHIAQQHPWRQQPLKYFRDVEKMYTCIYWFTKNFAIQKYYKSTSIAPGRAKAQMITKLETFGKFLQNRSQTWSSSVLLPETTKLWSMAQRFCEPGQVLVYHLNNLQHWG